MPSFLEIHKAHVHAQITARLVMRVSAWLRAGTWPSKTRIGALLHSPSTRRTLYDYERTIADLYNSLTVAAAEVSTGPAAPPPLSSARRNASPADPSTRGSSLVTALEGAGVAPPLFPSSSPHHVCWVAVDPVKSQVSVLYHAWVSFW